MRLTTTHWLIILIASIGFLFDTYELLMTPLVAAPAIAELLKVPQSNPLVAGWVGNLLWITALCGGVFGLWGGWLVDRFGRKSVMAASIFLYSLSPLMAAYSTSFPMFVFFRCTTFIGVCVEFVAAITWLSEVFEDKKQRERWLGITQAFASLGGVLVTLISIWIGQNLKQLPGIGLPVLTDGSVSTWRYLLISGFLPAIPIALLLPFVPESRLWLERRAAGTLRRPNLGQLFSPELRRVTLLTALLSACAYGIAFGALQITVARGAAGLPELQTQAKALGPLRKEADGLNKQLNEMAADDPGRKELVAKIKENFGKQKPFLDEVREMSETVQFRQEMGGLTGRILLAILLFIGMSRLLMIKMFQVPALLIIPITFFYLFYQGGPQFLWAYFLCGLVTVAQFSFFGEYLPKVFPLHLRGTGGSFATNVGGRMIGTSMATLNASWLAPLLAGGGESMKPSHIALAAGIIATSLAVIAFLAGFFLPEPGDIETKEK